MTSLLNPTSSSKMMTFCRTRLPGPRRKARALVSVSHTFTARGVPEPSAVLAVLSPAASAAGATEAFLEIPDLSKFLRLAKSPSQG